MQCAHRPWLFPLQCTQNFHVYITTFSQPYKHMYTDTDTDTDTHTHTHTHLFGCSVASTFWEEKSNIIFPFEPHFVVQWNCNSAFYKITAKRDNVMQEGLKSTWTWGSHGGHWWLLSLEMWHIVLWKQGTISEEDWYLIFHITHIPKESSLRCRICLKITRICVICTH